jgi:hypothetical protein
LPSGERRAEVISVVFMNSSSEMVGLEFWAKPQGRRQRLREKGIQRFRGRIGKLYLLGAVG